MELSLLSLSYLDTGDIIHRFIKSSLDFNYGITCVGEDLWSKEEFIGC